MSSDDVHAPAVIERAEIATTMAAFNSTRPHAAVAPSKASRRLSILHVTESFTGGVFASVTGLVNGLAERGHDVHLAFARRAETPTDVADHVHPSVSLYELDLVRSIDLRADWRGLGAIRNLLRRIEPDIVHLHSSKAGVLGRIAARLRGCAHKTFYSPRGLSFLQEDHSPRRRKLYEKIEWAVAQLGGTVVACSSSELELVRTRIRPRRCSLVENAVNVGIVVPRTPRADGRLRVGVVARVAFHKNPPLFARLARGVAAPNVDFIWIGGGEAAGAAMLAEAGVRVTGWLPRKDVMREIAALDIYLHPTLWEGMPIALIEAQVCGLPAVVRDAPGNRDVVVHGETGYVGRDYDELAAHLARLLGDATLRARMGARAREIGLARFNLPRAVDELELLYSGVV